MRMHTRQLQESLLCCVVIGRGGCWDTNLKIWCVCEPVGVALGPFCLAESDAKPSFSKTGTFNLGTASELPLVDYCHAFST